MMKKWIVYGLFVSFPEKSESWHELRTFSSFNDALIAASNKNENGVFVNGYLAFKIIERTYTDEIVYNSKRIDF